MQQRRPVVLATAAGVVLAIAVVAALVTWAYVRHQTPSGSPLAVAVVFAAVLAAGGVGLVMLAGRPELDVTGRGRQTRTLVAGSSGATAPGAGPAGGGTPERPSEPTVTDSGVTGSAVSDALDADPPTAEQPRTRVGIDDRRRSPRTALDPLGRRYGRHARAEAGAEPEQAPEPSELYHPLPTDLASTLHDQLFTHRTSGRD